MFKVLMREVMVFVEGSSTYLHNVWYDYIINGNIGYYSQSIYAVGPKPGYFSYVTDNLS